MSDHRPGLMSQSAPSTSAITSMASVVSRFAWLWLACGLIFFVSPQARGEETSTTGIKSVPDVIVYRGRYPGWPGLSATRGGKLVCVWREGDKHLFSAEGRLMLSESDDQGRTWTDARTFHDEPGVDDRNAGILALSDTDWLVCYNTYTARNVSRACTVRTKDAGKTWSAKQVIWDSDARTRSAPIRLTTGELVLPFYSEPPIQSLAAVSSDDGQTWRVVRIANHERFLGDEWSVAELPDGRLVGIIRNSGAGDPELNKRENRDPGHGDGVFYKTESRDRGQTWSDPQGTNLRDTASASPAQVFVHRGRPVVLYCDARMVSVSMAISDDPELLIWNVEDRLRCFLYNKNGRTISDGGYPVSAAVGGNRRLIVDYVLGGRSMAIEGYVVEMPSSWFDSSTAK